MIYEVTIREYLERSVKVDADSIPEAIEKGRKLWKNGDVVLDSSDFTDCMVIGTDPETEESAHIIID